MGVPAEGNGFLLKVDDLPLEQLAALGADATQPVVDRLPSGGTGQVAAFGSHI